MSKALHYAAVASAAEETHAQIRALNKRRASSRSVAEREAIDSLIDAAKAMWGNRVQHHLDAVRA